MSPEDRPSPPHSHPTHDALVGLILAGGKSQRLGRDKASLDLGGRTLLARSVELARRFCPEVYVSGRDPATAAVCGLDDCGLRWIPDETPGLGPIGGIATGLKRLKTALLVLPCDTPLLNAGLLERLVAARNQRPDSAVATAFAQPNTGHLESLVAVYEPEALPFLAEALRRGVHALWRAIPSDRWRRVFYEQSEQSAFLNLNTPDDVERYRDRLGQVGWDVPKDPA